MTGRKVATGAVDGSPKLRNFSKSGTVDPLALGTLRSLEKDLVATQRSIKELEGQARGPAFTKGLSSPLRRRRLEEQGDGVVVRF